MTKVDFVIVTRNEVSYTRKCIESIFKHAGCSFHLILVDNASDDGTREYFRFLEKQNMTLDQVTIILNDTNRGYVLGVNQGLERSTSPYVVLCNNDIVLYPNALNELIAVASQKYQFGLINPNSNEFGFGEYNESKLQTLRGTYRERCHTSGFFVLIKREVIQAIGGLDTTFSPGYFDDMDYSERAKHAGFLCLVANGAYVYHYGSRSFRPQEKQDLWKKHRALFTEKWGGTKWFAYLGDLESAFNSSHRKEITNRLLEIARRDIAILHLLVPKGSRKYFEGIHDSFRIVETLPSLQTLALLSKVWRSNPTKPISRIYVSNDHQMDVWKKLKPFHRKNVFKL